MSIFEHKDYANESDFLNNFKLDIPENFNFGFDCVDFLAENEPERIAAIWDSDNDEERAWTFAEMKLYSDGIARYLRSLGIGKGDRVMLILRRRIHFWFAIVALIKIGAIAIPATHHLVAEDVVYRNKSASINAIICTDDDKIVSVIEDAQDQSKSPGILIRIGEKCLDSYETKYEWQLLDKGMKENLEGPALPRVT